MSFISYAQNYEDVMLWRALKHIDKGFYIDVGANDPEIDSVTKAFYDRGWHGINVEPMSEWYEKLDENRAHDINLQLAAGARKGNIILYEIPGTGLSSTSETFAKQHLHERGYTSKKIKVPVVSLTSICKQFVHSDIHFLKIDVEGDEKVVIQGLDLSKYRPWILLIESNLPNSTKENHKEWEEFVLTANYDLAYVDGLNRFYVAKEKSDLLDSLRYPPNVFDDFIPSQQLKSEFRAQQSESLATQANEHADKALTLAEQTETRAKTAEANTAQANERADKALALAEQTETRAKTAEANTAQANERANSLKTQLFDKEQVLVAKDSEIEQLHARGQWLQNEWDAAKAKIDELNHSSHHWWTVADGLNLELQSVYRSKSWRITWPLRKLMQLLKWLLWFPVKLAVALARTARWFVHGSVAWLTLRPGSRPRRAASLALLHIRNWMLLRPRVRGKVVSILQRFPSLKAKLRSLHYANPPQAVQPPASSIADDVPMKSEHSLPDTSPERLTPLARKIYADLKLGVGRNQQEGK